MVYTYNEILRLKKEWDHYTCYNTDELWRYYAKWDKPDPKE